ncbi:hypothetical protein, partial [Jannaschia seohaensis]
MKFVEQGALEKGFRSVVQTRLGPKLEELEAKRKALLRKARLGTLAVFIAFEAAAGLLYLLVGGEGKTPWVIFVFAVVGVIAAFVYYNLQTDKWSGSLSDLIMPEICDHVGGLTFERDPEGRFQIATMRDLGMFGAHNRSTQRNLLSGTHHGMPFEIVQAMLEKTTTDANDNEQTTTVFEGLLFRIVLPRSVPTRILIAKDY